MIRKIALALSLVATSPAFAADPPLNVPKYMTAPDGDSSKAVANTEFVARNAVPRTLVGAPNGVAQLDNFRKLPVDQLPQIPASLITGVVAGAKGDKGDPGTPGTPGTIVTIPSAPLLAGTGTALSPVTLGTGLTYNNGVLSAPASGITVPSAPLLAGTGTALSPVTLGTGLALNSGVLSATAPAISVPTAPLLAGTGSSLAAANAASVAAVLGYTPVSPGMLGPLATESGLAATGDATGTFSGGTLPLTLPTVNTATATCGDAATVCQTRADAKGRTTAAAAVAIAVPHTAVTDWNSTVGSALAPYTPTSGLGPVARQAAVPSAPFLSTASDGTLVSRTLAGSDVIGALGYTPPTSSSIAATYAPTASPNLTGTPRVPTPSTAANDTTAVNAQWVKSLGFTTVPGSHFVNTWNAATNTPTLVSGNSPDTAGGYFKVQGPGTTTLDGISSWANGDWALFNGTIWTKVPYVGGGVDAINGLSGDVAITVSNIPGAFPSASAGPLATQSAVVAAPHVGTNSAGQIVPVTISSADVTGGLGFTPYSSANPSGFINTIPAATTGALGGVRPDGTTIANTGGQISVAYGTTSTTAANGADARILNAQQTSAKGQASGYASLDSTTHVPTSQLQVAAISAPGITQFPATGLTVDTSGNVQTNNQLYIGDLEKAFLRLPIAPGIAGTYWSNGPQIMRVPGGYTIGSTTNGNQLWLLRELASVPNTPGAAGTLWWNNDALTRVPGSYSVPTGAATSHDLFAAFTFIDDVPSSPTSYTANGGMIQLVPSS